MHVRDRLVRAARAAMAAMAAGAAAFAYRRQELMLVALLAAGVVGGFAIDAWHRRAPALLDRLEAEPPRLAPVSRTGRPRVPTPRRPPAAVRLRDYPVASARREAAPPRPTAVDPVDLDRATPAELSRLPGIGPRMAARILARREALGGRFGSFDDFASVPGLGVRRAGLLRSLVRLAADAAPLPDSRPARDFDPAPDAASPSGSGPPAERDPGEQPAGTSGPP